MALLVAHCSPVKAAPAQIVQAVAPSEEHQQSQMEDSPIFNIFPMLMNAPKTQKNFKFTADAEKQPQFKRSLSNTELFQ